MLATLISRTIAALALVAVFVSPMTVEARESFTSPDATFETAMISLKAGDIDKALPVLERAAAQGVFLAQFYLARVFSDSAGGYTDHAKAYMLYQRIADEYADVDPDDDQRAPFVAKSLTSLAEYVRDGVPEIGLTGDPERATEYLRHAATFFNDADAQFELAKIFLRAESSEDAAEDVKRAMHWLAVLTEHGHAGAQAFLADLYWRGSHVAPDKKRALALVSVAVENAPASEQVWIEDIYQNIYCGSSTAMRTDAAGVVTEWRRKYGRPNESADYAGLAPLGVNTTRTCSNGERVQMIEPARGIAERSSVATTSSLKSTLPTRTTPIGQEGTAPGSVIGIGLRQSEERGSTASH